VNGVICKNTSERVIVIELKGGNVDKAISVTYAIVMRPHKMALVVVECLHKCNVHCLVYLEFF
jgi:predicted metal-binding protein